MIPNPLVCVRTDSSRLRRRTSLAEYAGICKLLKHVCELGRRWSPPSASFTKLKFNAYSPFTGARSLPVEKANSLWRFSASHSSRTISQNHFTVEWSLVKPLL